MASESSTERTLSISLPAELEEWLDEQANAAKVGREELLVQLLASYRETAQLENGHEGEIRQVEEGDIASAVEARLNEGLSAELEGEVEGLVEDQVEAILEDRVDEILDSRIDEMLDRKLAEQNDSKLTEQLDSQIEAAVKDRLTEQVTEATNSVQRQLSQRIDTVESEFDDKIQDIRQRVIQVKKEADGKAPAEHTHAELDRIDSLSTELDELESELTTLREQVETELPSHEERLDGADDRIEQMQDRLQTVAWVLSDLRSAQESKAGLEAVERIKRAAAKADIERAKCENCGDGVTISLLTDPNCPHCDATVTNIEPAGGWFSKPKLLTAAQLESGEEQ